MKLLALPLVLAVLAAVFTSGRAAPADACPAGHVHPASPAHAERALPTAVPEVDLADHRNEWFASLDHYLDHPSINPEQRQLSAEEEELIQAAFAQASEEIDEITLALSRAKMDVVRRHVEERIAEAYDAGVTDVTRGAYADVLVATLEGSGPWVVRITHDELPMVREAEQQVEAIRSHTLDILRAMLQG